MVKSLRGRMKQIVRGAAAHVAPPFWRLGSKNRLLILMYHRVLPADHPARQFEQPGMIVAPETLDLHLRVLRDYFELIHVDEWLHRAASGSPLPKLACALTFDDGWRDNYDHAFPVLQKAKAPATIYLVSKMVGGTYGFWPTRLAKLLCESWVRAEERAISVITARCPAVAVPISVRTEEMGLEADRVIEAMKRAYDDESMGQTLAAAEREASLIADDDLLSWEQVRDMADSGLMRFGSHTRTHMRLGRGVDQAAAREEIVLSSVEVEEKIGRPVSGFCYPNGDHCPQTVEMVRHQYSHAVTTLAGWNDTSTDRVLLRRVGVHDDVSDTRAKLISRVALGF